MTKHEEKTSFVGAYAKAGMMLGLAVGAIWFFFFCGDLYRGFRDKLLQEPKRP